MLSNLVPLQALAADQQRSDLARTLNLRYVDIPALMQTILAGQASQRNLQPASIQVTQTQADPPTLQFQVELQPINPPAGPTAHAPASYQE
jgi:hypothetical protein